MNGNIDSSNVDPVRHPVNWLLNANLWYFENNSSAIYKPAKMLSTIKNTETLLVNGMLSSDLPAVNDQHSCQALPTVSLD